MYNRYIPQNDGTYCRKSIPERPKEPPKPPEAPLKPLPPPQPVPPLPCRNCPPPPKPRRKPPACRQEPAQGVGSFLKKLLPKDLCTEDLLIVLLLLLMAGDCPEEQNSALLTLALYLFL